MSKRSNNTVCVCLSSRTCCISPGALSKCGFHSGCKCRRFFCLLAFVHILHDPGVTGELLVSGVSCCVSGGAAAEHWISPTSAAATGVWGRRSLSYRLLQRPENFPAPRGKSSSGRALDPQLWRSQIHYTLSYPPCCRKTSVATVWSSVCRAPTKIKQENKYKFHHNKCF